MSGIWDSITDAASDAAAWVEDKIDTDDDGSLLDNVLSGAADLIGLSEENQQSAEDAGDFVTDLLGTRETGIFSEEGTLDVENTTDADYKGDGVAESGTGQWLNETLGIGKNDPKDLAEQAYDAVQDAVD